MRGSPMGPGTGGQAVLPAEHADETGQEPLPGLPPARAVDVIAFCDGPVDHAVTAPPTAAVDPGPARGHAASWPARRRPPPRQRPRGEVFGQQTPDHRARPRGRAPETHCPLRPPLEAAEDRRPRLCRRWTDPGADHGARTAGGRVGGDGCRGRCDGGRTPGARGVWSRPEPTAAARRSRHRARSTASSLRRRCSRSGSVPARASACR
ncbi:DUF6368 family protein [Streptomyces fimbriatus]|uniref:DUF6368 family protein n=1 Tax=Streptomyces fimbriatus TaxID=68197 RepID=UPI003CD05834